MPILPLYLTALIGGLVAHLAAALDRGRQSLRWSNYPVGVASAAFAALVSQELPILHNKLLVLSVVVPALVLLLYQVTRRVLVSGRARRNVLNAHK